MSTNLPTDEELFFEAIELPSGQRDGFLKQACSGDENRKQRIEKIIRSHQQNSDSGFILDAPLSSVAALQADNMGTEIGEKAGDQIGRYKLLERIGEGGMGVVYMAEQTVGVRRRVALKIIKLGMDTRQVIARFEAERQAMALFDHPSIAKVLDIGATESGRPYFVLELVKGKNLTEFIFEREMDLNEKLQLFVQICNAVQHAHQKGIIHRDLKPSNVLVTLYDGKPVPKVIDFGIAKAVGQQRLTDKTLFTKYSAMIGTPQYMSPEQAELTGIDVDTRSDVYSLGVLLYELVTGSTPLGAIELASMNPLALFETLRDTEVETPSVRLKRTCKELESSNHKPGDHEQLAAARLIERELDWVILKALSRDRRKRYATANELAADVKRFVDGDPVLAAPPSRVKKFAALYRRNRAAVVSTVAIASTLAAASVACLLFGVSAMRANHALNVANRQLNENIAKLSVAEAELQREAEKQKYDLAISIATIKFDQMLVQAVSETIEDDDPDAFLCCSGIESRRYLVLEGANELGAGLGKILECYDDSDEYSRSLLEANGWFEEDFEEGYEEHSSQCVEYRELFEEELAVKRHHYFRILVKQYRKVFGEQSPNVAEALILLAACLEEKGEVDESESHVREAIAIGNDADKKVARRLLTRVQKKRALLEH